MPKARRRSGKTNLSNGKTHSGLTKMRRSPPSEPFYGPGTKHQRITTATLLRPSPNHTLPSSWPVSRSKMEQETTVEQVDTVATAGGEIRRVRVATLAKMKGGLR